MFEFKNTYHTMIAEVYGEDPRLTKARLDGRTEARKRYNLETPTDTLKSEYLRVEKLANSTTEPYKGSFLWGVCEYIEDLLKKQKQKLPRPNANAWER